MSRRLGFWLIIALLMSCIAQKAARFSTLDPDAFWHLRVADQLTRQGIHPLVDDISYMSIRTPWTPYSWLAELGMKRVWDFDGLRGAIIAQSIVGAIVILFVAMACLEMTQASDRYMPAVVGTFAAGVWMLPFLAFRPVTLAIAILAAIAWLLLRDRRLDERSRAVWLVVPLTALLVNIHIFAILVTLWIAALFAGSLLERKPVARYGILLLLTLTALILTPMLKGIPSTIAHLAISDPMVASGQVQELGPIWSEAYGRFIGITGAIALGWIFYHRKLFRAGELIWLIGMTILVLRFGRFAPMFALIAAPMLARTLRGPSDRLLDKPFIAIACGVALLLGLWQAIAALPRAKDECAWLNRLGADSITYPCAAADFVEKNITPRSGHLINEMNEGGYLAWRLGPKWKILIDGRTQVYPPEDWRAYLGAPDVVKQFLQSTDADVAILPARKSRFRGVLGELGWMSAFRDERAEVLIPAPVAGEKPSPQPSP